MTELCECCGQPGGRCPGCGRAHAPALGVGACEQCCDDASYRTSETEEIPMRLCEVCDEQGRKRAMTNGVRHLHELEQGELFVDARGRARRVVKKSRGRVEVSAGMNEGETVEFERFDGTPVSFEVAPSSATEDWSETTIVRPLEEGRPKRAC